MLTIIARLKVKEGQGAELEATMTSLAAKVLENEPGCTQYQLCKSQNDNEYVMIERYADQEALASHGQTDHFKAALPALGATLDGRPQIEILTEVG